MFVQLIRGTTNDGAALMARGETWRQELLPGATGFLGSTSGVTDDGTFVLAACFEDAGAAKRNSDRPEQGAWWQATEPLLDEAHFLETEDVDELFGGINASAGFVQAMVYRPADRARLAELEEQMLPALAQARPDLVGTLRAWLADGTCYDLAYFTSEAEARSNEQKDPPPDLADAMQEMFANWGDVEFLDLHHPLVFEP